MKKVFTILMTLLMMFGIYTPNVVKADETYFKFDNVVDDQLEIDLFDPLELKVVLKDEKQEGISDVHYTWLLESTSINPTTIEKASDSSVLYIPSFNFITAKTDRSGIECVIDFKLNGETKREFVGVDLNINQSIFDGSNKVVFIGGYTIKQGETLDLAHPNDSHGDSPIGKGKISLSEKGDQVILDNVVFDYDLKNLCVDKLFTRDKGFAYYSFLNNLEDISFILKGKNKITNSYHIDNNDNDGTTFLMSLTTDGSPKMIDVPTYHIIGNGSLEINGGTYCIAGMGVVDVNTKLSVNSTKDPKYPGRFGNGIIGANIIVNKNADIKLDIAGYGISANISNDPELGKIDIKPGSKIDMTIRNYVRHPFSKQLMPSISNGIYSTNAVDINSADVDIKLIADKKVCDDYEKEFPEEAGRSIKPYSLCAIGNTGSNSPYNLTINNSQIDIELFNINCPKDEKLLTYARGINFVNSGNDDDNTGVIVNNSIVNIDLFDNGHNTSQAIGISTMALDIEGGNLNINASSINKSIGIKQLKSLIAKHEKQNTLNVKNADVNIQTNDIGILAEKMNFDYNVADKEFVIDSGEIAIASDLNTTGEERKYEDDFVSDNIKLVNNTVEEYNKTVNIYSSESDLKYSNSVTEQLTDINNLSYMLENESEKIEALHPSLFKMKEESELLTKEEKERLYGVITRMNSPYLVTAKDEVSNYLKQVDVINPTITKAEETTYYYYETFYDGDKNTVSDRVVIKAFVKNGYDIIDGKDATINIYEGKDASFTSNADRAKFVEVQVDGKKLSKDNYLVLNGSTRIILKSAFLKTLMNGNHNISIVSTDGNAETTFTVVRSVKPIPTPTPTTPYVVPNTVVK